MSSLITTRIPRPANKIDAWRRYIHLQNIASEFYGKAWATDTHYIIEFKGFCDRTGQRPHIEATTPLDEITVATINKHEFDACILP